MKFLLFSTIQTGSGTSEEDVAHNFDLARPYVVTTTLTTATTLIPTEIKTVYTGDFIASQPGSGSVSARIIRNYITINQFNSDTLEEGEGANFLSLGQHGGNTHFMGIAFGGAHADIVEALARNYEGYTC